MSNNNKKDQEQTEKNNPTDKKTSSNSLKKDTSKPSVEEKLKDTEDKLLRSLAEIEKTKKKI